MNSWNFGGGERKPMPQLPPIKKNNYVPVDSVQQRNQRQINQWLADKEVTLVGNDIPGPIFSFDESSFPKIIRELLHSHYQQPTVIQSITWPVALTGRDVISIAKTGSGKTLGFILPAIVHVMNQPQRQRGEGPSVVVLLPTRELALQVLEVAAEYCKAMGLNITCCYGGAPRTQQYRDLMTGVDVCIATPGRLLDFLDSRTTNMDRCTFFVLDEADRMLDMGFEPQIRRIAEQIRPDRQTLMFSATWPKDVRQLAADFHQDPVHLTVGSLDLAANHNIQQNIEIIEDWDKQKRLIEILQDIIGQDPKTKILIFVDTKRKADELTRLMRRDGMPALCIHGDKEQREREWVLSEFKFSRMPILIATDVAARGLDVDDIKFVINFDYPNNSEDYVHRIGRTGRRERHGTAITFFTSQNAPKARDLIKVLEEAKQMVPAELANLANNGSANAVDSFRSRRRGGSGGGAYGATGTGANRFPIFPRNSEPVLVDGYGDSCGGGIGPAVNSSGSFGTSVRRTGRGGSVGGFAANGAFMAPANIPAAASAGVARRGGGAFDASAGGGRGGGGYFGGGRGNFGMGEGGGGGGSNNFDYSGGNGSSGGW